MTTMHPQRIPYTKYEDRIILENYGHKTTAEIAAILGRPATGVQVRMTRLHAKGLLMYRKDRNYGTER